MFHETRWEEIRTKQDALHQFLENPNTTTTVRLFESLWSMTARSDVESYVRQTVLDNPIAPDAMAERLASPFNQYRAGNQSDALEDLLDHPGVGSAVATELLHTMDPREIPLWNKPARQFMKDLVSGYNPATSFLFDYDHLCEFYNLVLRQEETIQRVFSTMVEEDKLASFQENEYQSEPTLLQQYDYLAYARTHSDHSVVSRMLSDDTSRSTDQPQLNPDLLETVREHVRDNPTYESIEEFFRSAVRNELGG